MVRRPWRPRCSPQTSLDRRLRSASAWRYTVDAALAALGWQRSKWFSELVHLAGSLAIDLSEVLRTGRSVPCLGQAHLAAFGACQRLAQDPRYRGYWYDADRHALVGMHLVIDLNRYQDRFHVIEINVDPAMRPERRRLYEADVDPLLAELAGLARARGFERIVLIRQAWSVAQAEELSRAGRQTGIEFFGASVAALAAEPRHGIRPMVALPRRLRPQTIYVVGTPAGKTPLFHLIHNKLCSARWLAEAIRRSGGPASPLAAIPAFERLVVPPEPSDRRWPNLVVKLANADYAQAVVMGRFATELEARRELRLDDDPDSVPGVFPIEAMHRLWHLLVGGRPPVLYQPFVPPEVADRRARHIRLHVFTSPLADAFLSADGVTAGEDLPDNLPSGLVTRQGAYVVSFSRGGSYCRLANDTECELRHVAEEFGRLLRSEVEQRFTIAG